MTNTTWIVGVLALVGVTVCALVASVLLDLHAAEKRRRDAALDDLVRRSRRLFGERNA